MRKMRRRSEDMDLMVVSGKTAGLRLVRLVLPVGLPGSYYRQELMNASAVCHFEWERIDSRGRRIGCGELIK